MIDKNIKSAMEVDIMAKFPTMDITVPPSHATSVTFDTRIEYMHQTILDPLADPDVNAIVIGLDYPVMDEQWIRMVSDFHGSRKTPVLVSEEAWDDAVQNFSANPVSLNIPITFSTLQKLDLIVYPQSGSTSWLSVKVINDANVEIFRRTYFPSHFITDGFTEIPMGISIPLVSGAGVFTVVLTSLSQGSSPSGYSVGTSAGSVGYAYKIYDATFADYWGKINSGAMRFMVFAKSKDIGKSPSSGVSLDKQDIVMQAIRQLRSYIWGNWNKYKINNIRETIPSYGELPSIGPWMSAMFDVIVIVEDIGYKTDQADTPIKELTLNIEDIS